MVVLDEIPEVGWIGRGAIAEELESMQSEPFSADPQAILVERFSEVLKS